MTHARRGTPTGTWPVVVAGALLLVFAPLAFALPAFPSWLAILVVTVFAIGSTWALVTSVVLLVRTRGTRAQGAPIIGCVLGVILAPPVFALMMPMLFS